MLNNGNYQVKFFEIGDEPTEFSIDNESRKTYEDITLALHNFYGYKGGKRRYAIVYVKNTIGERFFYSPSGNYGDEGYLWDFANKGFCLFPSYNSIPEAIKKNAVEFSFETKLLPEDKSFLFGSVIRDREGLPNDTDCDLVLVKEYYWGDGNDDEDANEISGADDHIICDIAYNLSWVCGRYFGRIQCISADITSEEANSLAIELDACNGSEVPDIDFAEGRYWRNCNHLFPISNYL